MLFGSAARGRLTAESDIDVGIYFFPARDAPGGLELEEDQVQDGDRSLVEKELWRVLQADLAREVEAVNLNHAPAAVVASAMTTGIPCIVRDEDLYSRVLRASLGAAEDFRRFEEEFLRVRERSGSISEIDRARLYRIMDFLAGELSSASQFQGMEKSRFLSEPDFRRNAERWVANLVNASTDIGKIIVASLRLPMPQTYREVLSTLAAVDGFAVAEEAAGFTRVRNVLAHEYLDMKFPEVQHIADAAHRVYGALMKATRRWLESSGQAPAR